VLGVAEARNSEVNTISASRSNYELPIDELNFGSADKDNQSNSGGSSEAAQVGFVYRINYDYAGKYLFETTGRYDGHYYFAPGEKFGFFPAVALGWRISEESFMSGIGSLDNLKIRASAGQSGALAGGPNQYSSALTLYGNAFPFGGSATMGVFAGTEGNPDITWEKATKYNVGFEFSLWNRLIAGEVDYFFETRDNMLLSPASTVPQEYGIALAQVNAGKMQNQGIEFNLNSRKSFSNGLHLGLDFNFTFARNELLEIFENEVTYNDPLRRRTGKPLNTFFGLEAVGIFQESDDSNGDGIIDAADGFPEQLLGGTIRPGNIQYKDLNGDGVVDGTDETAIGNPAVPEIIYSIIPSVSWKGFDFNMMLQGAGNTDMHVEGPWIDPIILGLNMLKVLAEDSWTPENTDARFHRLSMSGNTRNDDAVNSWYLYNAAYLRLKHVELGYTIPENIISFASLRVYFSGTNLLTWNEAHKLGLWDPEIDQDSRRHGISTTGRGNYHPQVKSFSFGVNLTF